MARRRLGILGGTFDPVHHGHLLLALYAQEQLKCSKVLLIPNAQSPFKNQGPEAPFPDRFSMIQSAISDTMVLAVSDLEGRRGGISYMVDTLRALRRDDGQCELILIVGSDACRDIPVWKESEAIRDLAQIAVVARGEEELPPLTPGTHVVHMPRFDVSASEIRRRVREGRSIDFLTPPEVVRYIRAAGLYRTA